MKPSALGRGMRPASAAAWTSPTSCGGELAGEVDEGRGLGVEELRLVVTHGVFEGAEGGEEVLEGEGPHAVGVGLGAGEVEVFDGAEVVGVAVGDVGDDLGGDVVGREAGRGGDGDLALVGVAVIGVVGELAAEGFAVLHEDAGALTLGAVEAIHDVALGVGACLSLFEGAVDGGEVSELGEPGGVGDLVEMEALGDSLGEVEAEFALGGAHDGEGGELAVLLEGEQGLAVAYGREVVEDSDAAGGLLEGEVAHVADEEDELFLVVGAAEGLGGRLDDDDAGLVGGLFGEGAGAVGEAVVGDVDPAALGYVFGGGLGGADEAFEEGRDGGLCAGGFCGAGAAGHEDIVRPRGLWLTGGANVLTGLCWRSESDSGPFQFVVGRGSGMRYEVWGTGWRWSGVDGWGS